MRPLVAIPIVAACLLTLFLGSLFLVVLTRPNTPTPVVVAQPQQFGGGLQPFAFVEPQVDIVEAPFAPPFAGAAPQAPIARADVPAARGAMVVPEQYRISAAHTHGNLSVYLIHGPDVLENVRIVTLEEAVNQNLAVVHDTRTGQLAIDNRGNTPLFIQAGDIVKGGTQDRVLPYDLLVPPLAMRQPLPALCVEAGRSGPRGTEVSASFASSTEQLPGRRLKLAAYRNAQADVWAGVQQLQDQLTRTTKQSVRAPLSQTSLQLTLEHANVQREVMAYQQTLVAAPDGHADVIGYAVAVNGKLHTADVYASSALFRDLWPKLLRASAVEALAERGSVVNPAPEPVDVQAWMVGAEAGNASQQVVSARTSVLRHETAQSLLFDTCDRAAGNVVVHRSFLTK